jgi:NTP pyrophosphatase (non-canonical NTP hydrolase)
MTTYLEKAMRTKADTYFRHMLPQQLFDDMLVDVIVAARMVESAKKALFYGKEQVSLQNLATYYESQPTIVSDEKNQIRHAIMGIVGEAGELASLVADPESERMQFIDEAGDILWYLALLFDQLGVTFEEVQDRNIAKLTERYPAKFTTEQAINRNVEKEQLAFS